MAEDARDTAAREFSEAIRHMKTLDFKHADFCRVQHEQFKEMDRRKQERAKRRGRRR